MNTFFGFFSFIAFLTIIIGLIKPELVIRWGTVKTRGRVMLIYGSSFLIFSIISGNTKDKKVDKPEEKQVTAVEKQDTSVAKEQLKVGSTISSKRWEITLNSFKVSKSVDTGNPFARLKPEEGNLYIIMNVTYKNIDNTGRTLTREGKLNINYNGKDYEFDKAEHVMLKGWGLFLQPMNPLTKTTTNLVFKIPSEIKGTVFWDPENGVDEKFLAGELK